MRVTYLNTTLDFERYFYRYQGDYFRTGWKEKPLVSLAMLLTVAAILNLAHSTGGRVGASVVFALFASLPFIGFRCGGIARYLAHRLVERLPKSITVEKTVELSDDAVTLSATYIEQTEDWGKVESIDGQPPYVFIKSPNLAIVIPGAAFPSESDRQVFLDFAIEAFESARRVKQDQTQSRNATK